MAKIAFRLATAADVDGLVNLRARFLAEVRGSDASDPGLLLAMRRYFQQAIPAGDFAAFVAMIGSEMAGTAGMVFHTHPPTAANLTGRRGHILNVYTLPQFRKRGIASLLLKKLIEHAQGLGIGRIYLHAMPEARAIYEKLGFEATEDEMRIDLGDEKA